MENNNENIHDLSNEKKDMVLKNTQKYADDLESLEKMHNTVSPEIEDEQFGEKESYDLKKDREKNRKKERKRVNNRRLGYHRRYLYSDVKISNILLLIIFIVLTIFVIAKYAIPEKSKTSDTNIIEKSVAKFGSNIDILVVPNVKDSHVDIKVTVSNNEASSIKFTPASIKLKSGDNIYIPTLTDKDKAAVPVEGLKRGESASFYLKYNIDKGSIANSSLEAFIIGGSETCVLIASLGL